MKELKNYPTLPYASVRKPETVEANDLNSINVNTGAFGIHANDIFEFGSDEMVVRQPLESRDEKSTHYAYYITCLRNKKPSFVSASQLIRRGYDKDGKLVYVGKLQEHLATLPSLKEQLEELAGKTLYGSAPTEFAFAVFENGIRTDKRESRMISVLTDEEPK